MGGWGVWVVVEQATLAQAACLPACPPAHPPTCAATCRSPPTPRCSYELPALFNSVMLQYRVDRGTCVHRLFHQDNGTHWIDGWGYGEWGSGEWRRLRVGLHWVVPCQAAQLHQPALCSCLLAMLPRCRAPSCLQWRSQRCTRRCCRARTAHWIPRRQVGALSRLH